MSKASVPTSKSTRPDTYQLITDRIMAQLEAGTIPWRKSWSNTSANGRAFNIRGTSYHGINRVILGFGSPYESPLWMTFKQTGEHGGHVLRGEHGWPVVFWHILDVTTTDDETGEEKTKHIPAPRYYTVFNLQQTDGVRVPEATAHLVTPRPIRVVEPIEAADIIVAGYHNAPTVGHGGDKAFYRPSTDSVTMPPTWAFAGMPAYYQTLFHELGHSTGHPSRLARPGITDPSMFGSHTYSKEELVAEMTSAFLCADAGIDSDPSLLTNAAAYIASWLKVLANDKRMVITAAAQAQKAADHILGTTAQAAPDAEPLAA